MSCPRRRKRPYRSDNWTDDSGVDNPGSQHRLIVAAKYTDLKKHRHCEEHRARFGKLRAIVPK
jgi:hypothetical protein